jgi:predicted ATPase
MRNALRVPPIAIESPRQPSHEAEPQVRIGISGTHGTGKTTLAEALCAHLPGHVAADEPYYLLEQQGYDFGFPPSPGDYRALLACSVRSLTSPPPINAVIFDRTPLDYLAYLAANGADLSEEASTAKLQPAFASLDLLVITPITPETEQVLPAAEMPGLRVRMDGALLELVYDDPLNAWPDLPVLELSGPLDGRLDTVLSALDQARRPARPGRAP